jgi:hypothetical protein
MSLPNDDTASALRRLLDTGSDLTKPMTMDFFVLLPSEEAARTVARRADALGFATSVYETAGMEGWTCSCTKTIVPSYDVVVDIEQQLDAIGREHGGHADGFGSFGNAGGIPN